MKYILQTHGCTHCPEFDSLPAARAALLETVAAELKRCRARFHSGRKHKLAPDCYRITLGPDRQSAMWSHHCILAA